MHTCLVKRGSIFYVRVRVPRELLPLYDKPEIKYSLKTSNGKEAVRRVRIELTRIEKDLAERRNNTIVINDLAPRDIRSLPESELREIASTIAMHHLEGDESTRPALHREKHWLNMSGNVVNTATRFMKFFTLTIWQRIARPPHPFLGYCTFVSTSVTRVLRNLIAYYWSPR